MRHISHTMTSFDRLAVGEPLASTLAHVIPTKKAQCRVAGDLELLRWPVIIQVQVVIQSKAPTV